MKAVLTVEASYVFGITLIIIYIVVAFSFTMYSETYSYVNKIKPDEIDVVTGFKLLSEGKEIIEKKGQ